MATAKLTLIGLLAGAVLFAACGSDPEEANPDKDTPSFTSEDASTEEEDVADAGNTPEAKTADAASSERDASSDKTDGATPSSVDGGADCSPKENKDGFYLCTPETNLQFLNQFVDKGRGIAQVSFDNTARIPGYVAGKLPALP
jgi:hypothetical protein